MKKIKIQAVSLFLVDFYANKYPEQRLGQAFVNTYSLKEPVDVFYETDDKKVTEIIFANYVDF